jgi:hypothetical protein
MTTQHTKTETARHGPRAIRVTFSDGDSVETSINGTDEEIKRYYLGQQFNVGSGGEDRMVTATAVEFLNACSRCGRTDTTLWNGSCNAGCCEG